MSAMGKYMAMTNFSSGDKSRLRLEVAVAARTPVLGIKEVREKFEGEKALEARNECQRGVLPILTRFSS